MTGDSRITLGGKIWGRLSRETVGRGRGWGQEWPKFSREPSQEGVAKGSNGAFGLDIVGQQQR